MSSLERKVAADDHVTGRPKSERWPTSPTTAIQSLRTRASAESLGSESARASRGTLDTAFFPIRQRPHLLID